MGQIFSDDSEFKKYLSQKGTPPAKQQPKQASFNEDTPKSKPEVESKSFSGLKAETRNIITPPAKTVPSKYTLDLSSVDLEEQALNTPPNYVQPTPELVSDEPEVQLPKQSVEELQSQVIKKIQPTPKVSPKENGKLKNFFYDNLRTLLNATAIFLILYLLLNFSAYKEVIIGKYYDLTGQDRETALTIFSEELNQLQDELLSTQDNEPTTVTSIEDGETQIIVPTSNSSRLPKFDMEITPPGTRVIIPRLAKNVPVVSVSEDNLLRRDWDALENDLQKALRDGVVHYPGTPWPGQSGNVVLTGHSSYYPWDPGRFKDVFAILHNVQEGDEIIVFHNQQKFVYRVAELKEVKPDQVEVLGDTGDNRLTMLTCTPIGTNLRRLIVTAYPVES